MPELSTLGGVIDVAYENEPDNNAFTDSEKAKLAAIEAFATGDQTPAEILAALLAVDGPGSGLNADLLDGLSSEDFASAADIPAIVTPEAHGAVGNGTTNDAAAFDAAIAAAVSTGQLLKGDPSKVYYIATNLADFTGSLRIEDVTFRAPNNVRLLRGNPTWAAENTTVSSLTSVSAGGSAYATQVNLSSTSGLAVGDWVMVGSRSQTWPANPEVWWFEAAQIISLVTNTNLVLSRRLLGEQSGLLTLDLGLYKIPNYRLEARRLRFEVDGNPFATGQINRRTAIELRGGLNHRLIDCHAVTWWGPFIQLRSAVKSHIINPSWSRLPDLPISDEAFGYGIQIMGAAYSNHVIGMNGGACRHGFTNSASLQPTYPIATPWSIGIPSDDTISASKCSGHSHAAFDTHDPAIRTTFQSCVAVDPTVTQLGSAHNFQDRGFRTRFIGCTSRGGRFGWNILTAERTWPAALGENVCALDGCYSENHEDWAIRFEFGLPGATCLINDFTAVGGGSVLGLIAGSVYKIKVDGLTARAPTGSILEDASGNSNVQLLGVRVSYDGLAAALVPFRVDAIGTGALLISAATILRRTASSPNGLIEVNVASALAVTLGQIGWDLGATFPDLSPSSIVGASLVTTELEFRAAEAGDATSFQGVPLDATVGSPADGNILVYRTGGADWVLEAKPAPGSTPSLDDITNVALAGVADNNVLAFDNASGNWINQTAAQAGLATAAQGTLAGTALQPAAIGTTVQGQDPELQALANMTDPAGKLAGIEPLATADQTPTEIRTALLTVDGAGSGIDADLVDGQHAAAFATAAQIAPAALLASLVTVDGPGSGLDADTLDGQSSAAFATAAQVTPAALLASLVTVDGPGSGLDADTLDGLSSAAFATAAQVAPAALLSSLLTVDGPASGLNADLLDGLDSTAFLTSASIALLQENHVSVYSYPPYAASTAYTLGQRVYRVDGGFRRMYEVTTAGTSGASSPPSGTGTGIVDGTVVWAYFADSFFTIDADNPAGSAGLATAGIVNTTNQRQFWIKVDATQNPANGGAVRVKLPTAPASTERRMVFVERSANCTAPVYLYGFDAAHQGEVAMTTADRYVGAIWSPETAKWERALSGVQTFFGLHEWLDLPATPVLYIPVSNADYILIDDSGSNVTIAVSGTLTANRSIQIDALALPSSPRARSIRVLNRTTGAFTVTAVDPDDNDIATIAQGWGLDLSATVFGVVADQHFPITAGDLAALNIIGVPQLKSDIIADFSTISTVPAAGKLLVSDSNDGNETKAITYANLLAQLTAAIATGGADNYDHETDSGNYATTAFVIGTGGAAQDEWRKFSTVAAHKFHFPAGLPENAMGVIEAPEGSGSTFTSAVGISVNGVSGRTAGTALAFPGKIASWARADDGSILVLGDLGEVSKAYANHNMDGHDILNVGAGTTYEAPASAHQTALGISAAAQTILDDASVAAMLATLGGLPLAGGTMSGELVMADQLLTRAYLKDTAEVINTVASVGGLLTLDMSTGNNFFVDLFETITAITFSNWPASGRVGTATVYFEQDVTPRTVTFTGVTWEGAGTAPAISTAAGDVDIFMFMTRQGGGTIRGFIGGQGF